MKRMGPLTLAYGSADIALQVLPLCGRSRLEKIATVIAKDERADCRHLE